MKKYRIPRKLKKAIKKGIKDLEKILTIIKPKNMEEDFKKGRDYHRHAILPPISHTIDSHADQWPDRTYTEMAAKYKKPVEEDDHTDYGDLTKRTFRSGGIPDGVIINYDIFGVHRWAYKGMEDAGTAKYLGAGTIEDIIIDGKRSKGFKGQPGHFWKEITELKNNQDQPPIKQDPQ